MYHIKDEFLDRFKNELSIAVLKQFLVSNPNDVNEGGGHVGRSLMWLPRLDAWMTTLVQCLLEGDVWGHCQKVYADTYGMFLLKAVEQFIGKFRVYAEFWVGEEFFTFPNGYVTKFRRVPSMREKYLALNRTWLREYITKAFGTVHDYHEAKGKENGEIEKLGRAQRS